jgi:proteasome lid subunit RPN8/RPN11
MAKERREGSVSLDIEALIAEKGSLRRMESAMEEVGCWHTHPDRNGTPSKTDMATMLNARDFLDRASYVELILTAARNDDSRLISYRGAGLALVPGVRLSAPAARH